MARGANGSWGEGLTVASGRIWVTLTVHAKRAFVDAAAFRDLRGTHRFQELVESLAPRLAGSSRFRRDDRSEELRKIGYRAGVFNQHALEQELAPVYRFTDEAPPFPGAGPAGATAHDFAWRHDLESFPFPPLGLLEEEDRRELARTLGEGALAQGVADLFAPLAEELRGVWAQWRKWILLTRYGYFQIWLRRSCRDESLAGTLQAAMKLNTRVDFASAIDGFERSGAAKSAGAERLVASLRRSGRSGARPFVTIFQWEIARLLIHRFLSELERGEGALPLSPLRLRSGLDESWNKEADPEEGLDLPLRYRHSVFHFTELARKGEGSPLPPGDLSGEDELALASLLEGVPVRDAGAPGGGRIPPLQRRQLEELVGRSSASWDGELMLITGDSTLLVTPWTGRSLVFDDDVAYLDYWLAVLRGLAHFCEMRVLALQLRAETKGLLDRSLTGRDATPRLSHESRIASTLLARLRTAADPAAVGGGDYAVDKLRQASRAFELPEAVQAAQHNLELVNAAIDQEESMSLERSQASLNLGVAGFAVVTVLLSLVPFWASASLPRSELAEAFPFYLRHARLLDLLVGGSALLLVGLTAFVLLPLFVVRVFGDSLSFVLLRRRRRKLHGRRRFRRPGGAG